MVNDPLFRLLDLDISLLLNIRAKAVREAGALLSLPLQITVMIFIIISVIKFKCFPKSYQKPNQTLKPWMVKYQFSLAYGKRWKKVVDKRFKAVVLSNLFGDV
jgi:hypothetical protein